MYPTGKLSIETLDLPIQNLPSRLTGLKITQMSDFHDEGWGLSKKLLSQAIAASNREYPDLVLLTGDYITSRTGAIDPLADQLRSLQSRYGTYAILGNHDVLTRESRVRVTDSLTRAGITVLWEEICYPCGPGLALVGCAELKARNQFQPDRLFPQIPDEIPRIVLAHNPDCAEFLKPWRVDLQLSGHTHGGQILVPGLGSLPAIATHTYHGIPDWVKAKIPALSKMKRIRQNWDWERGLHKIDRGNGDRPNLLYTNRGLGTYPPGRLFCPPEVTLFRLYPS
jgi:uncharacterized protein